MAKKHPIQCSQSIEARIPPVLSQSQFEFSIVDKQETHTKELEEAQIQNTELEEAQINKTKESRQVREMILGKLPKHIHIYILEQR